MSRACAVGYDVAETNGEWAPGAQPATVEVARLPTLARYGAHWRVVLILAAVAACGRVEKPTGNGSEGPVVGSDSASKPSSTPPQAASSGRYTGKSGSAASAGDRAVSATPPPTFEGAKSVVLVNNDAAGCIGQQRDGWVQVTCDAETRARGRVVKAEVREGTLAVIPDVAPLPDGRLEVVLPWQAAKRGLAIVEFEKGTFELTTNNAAGGFRRVLPKAQADACDKLAREFAERLDSFRELESGPVRAADVRRFPKLGKCEVEGGDAWALEIKDVRAAGESVEREVSVTLNVVHVDTSGALAKAAWGPVAFAPGKLAISEVSLFDYDGDGAAEAIIRHEVLARGEHVARNPQPKLPAVFTYKHKRTTAYAPALIGGIGGTVAEQLENDGRPDLGDYGPYVAWLGLACGVGKCPQRVVGPRFYRRSLPDGSFAANAPEVTAALQRACSRNQGGLVTDIESVGGKTRTALNVACARVRGDSAEALILTLNQEKSRICGDATDCQLHSVLSGWAKVEPPLKLVLPRKE